MRVTEKRPDGSIIEYDIPDPVPQEPDNFYGLRPREVVTAMVAELRAKGIIGDNLTADAVREGTLERLKR